MLFRATVHPVATDSVLKAMNAVHRLVRWVSGERLGWNVNGMRVVELTTTGRRSGRPHTVMLTSPAEADGAIVIVASRGGDPHHPAWFLNLRADPRVTVRLARSERQPMRARAATADERAELWPLITARHRNYARYQAKTAREIPLVLLNAEPTSP